MNENRKFKGVWIPREVWLNPGLTIHEKVMLVEIDSLDNERGCFARDAHFCEFLGVKDRRVREILKSLKEKGLIEISYTYREGTKEIQSRIIRVTKESGIYSEPLESEDVRQDSAEGVAENCQTYGRKLPRGVAENCRDSNTSNRNTDRDIQESRGQISEEQQLFEPDGSTAAPVDSIPYSQIQDLYNEICGDKLRRCQRLTAGRKKAIAARWKEEGQTVEFFRNLFTVAADSGHLRGENDRGWIADIDFLLRPEKMVATLEGKYKNNKGTKHNGQLEDNLEPHTTEELERKIIAQGGRIDEFPDFDAIFAQ